MNKVCSCLIGNALKFDLKFLVQFKKAQRGRLQLDVLACSSRHPGGAEGKLLLCGLLGELLPTAGLRLQGGRPLHRRGTKNRDFSSVLGQKNCQSFGKFIARRRGTATRAAFRNGRRGRSRTLPPSGWAETTRVRLYCTHMGV